jgi:hypothetical protein
MSRCDGCDEALMADPTWQEGTQRWPFISCLPPKVGCCNLDPPYLRQHNGCALWDSRLQSIAETEQGVRNLQTFSTA